MALNSEATEWYPQADNPPADTVFANLGSTPQAVSDESTPQTNLDGGIEITEGRKNYFMLKRLELDVIAPLLRDIFRECWSFIHGGKRWCDEINEDREVYKPKCRGLKCDEWAHYYKKDIGCYCRRHYQQYYKFKQIAPSSPHLTCRTYFWTRYIQHYDKETECQHFNGAPIHDYELDRRDKNIKYWDSGFLTKILLKSRITSESVFKLIERRRNAKWIEFLKDVQEVRNFLAHSPDGEIIEFNIHCRRVQAVLDDTDTGILKTLRDIKSTNALRNMKATMERTEFSIFSVTKADEIRNEIMTNYKTKAGDIYLSSIVDLTPEMMERLRSEDTVRHQEDPLHNFNWTIDWINFHWNYDLDNESEQIDEVGDLPTREEEKHQSENENSRSSASGSLPSDFDEITSATGDSLPSQVSDESSEGLEIEYRPPDSNRMKITYKIPKNVVLYIGGQIDEDEVDERMTSLQLQAHDNRKAWYLPIIGDPGVTKNELRCKFCYGNESGKWCVASLGDKAIRIVRNKKHDAPKYYYIDEDRQTPRDGCYEVFKDGNVYTKTKFPENSELEENLLNNDAVTFGRKKITIKIKSIVY